jgi:hypothetical protein
MARRRSVLTLVLVSVVAVAGCAISLAHGGDLKASPCDALAREPTKSGSPASSASTSASAAAIPPDRASVPRPSAVARIDPPGQRDGGSPDTVARFPVPRAPPLASRFSTTAA